MTGPKPDHNMHHFDGNQPQTHTFGDEDANQSRDLDADNLNAFNTEDALKQKDNPTVPVAFNTARSSNNVFNDVDLDSSRIMVPSEKELT